MKKTILLLTFCSVQFMYAALPPSFQNTKDLHVMVAFIDAHPKVSSTLESIDFKSLTVFFNKGCKATFGRKTRTKPKGWAGPAAPLGFRESNCEIE